MLNDPGQKVPMLVLSQGLANLHRASTIAVFLLTLRSRESWSADCSALLAFGISLIARNHF